MIGSHRAMGPLKDYINGRFSQWRNGSTEGQIAVLATMLAVVVMMAIISLHDYTYIPTATFVIPIVLGYIILRWRPLAVLSLATVLAAAATGVKVTLATEFSAVRFTTFAVVVIVALVLVFSASRNRSGLPSPVGEAMLVDLRDRLQAQSKIPALPHGWAAQSAMLSSGGSQYAGDFLVADLTRDEQYLEMVLVDVCGKGVAAGTQSLHFAGALGGLIGALPPEGLFLAANDFLLRQHWDDGFATAVHVLVNLASGEFSIINAGHPPALRWQSSHTVWDIDGARGMALGIQDRPEFTLTRGRLETGDALMFYTDGVVESHSQDFTAGIEWLRETAQSVVATGFDLAAKRILGRVKATDDDRAVLIVRRD